MTSFSAILINTTSIALLVFVIIYAWYQRKQTAALQLMIATFFMLIWASGTFCELLAASDVQKLIWRNITQIGVFYTPAACLLFSVSYSGMFARFKKRLSIVLYTVQTVSIALIFTDSWLHLMREHVDFVQSGASRVIAVESTTLARLLISLNFIFLVASLLLLIIYAVRTNSNMRRQVALTTIGMGVAAVFAFLKVASGEHFAPGMPISGVFGVVCFIMLLGIIRYDFLKVLPVARNEVFNIIEEGIIVVSPKGAVLDVNEAAARFFSLGLPEAVQRDEKGFFAIGEALRQQYPKWQEALTACRTEKLEFTKAAGGEDRHFHCSTYPLDRKGRQTLGTISVIRDVTEQKIKNDLLRERAERDGLLGILNRQTFFERAAKELDATKKESSIAVFDIDDFKTINDRFGHIAGDHVLRKICACVQRVISPDTLFGRIGGEEFAVFFCGEGPEGARRVSERIRLCIAEERMLYDRQSIAVTISIGIASGQGPSLQPLYQRADRMLYQAKALGKNRIASQTN